MYTSFFSSLAPNDLIITVNQRLAAFLQQEYSCFQKNLGHQAWHTPDILALPNWASRCWQSIQLHKLSTLVLLSPIQQQTIWEQIIQASAFGADLLRINATASMAIQAWQLCLQWQIQLKSSLFTLSEETRAWQAWALEFQTLCQQKGWIDAASLPREITRLLDSGSLPPPARLFLVGFDEINPQLQTMLDTIVAKNGVYQLINPQLPVTDAVRIGLIDTDTEIQVMARWAQQIITRDSNAQIACVIPNLAEIRTQVLNEFTDIFIPEAKLPGNETPSPFNISAGVLLQEYTLIKTALLSLSLGNEMPLSTLSALLCSPYLAHAEQEMTARAELDAVLRAQGDQFFLPTQVVALAKRKNCLQFALTLENFIKLPNQCQSFLLPSQWAARYTEQLATLGWPGERILNSTEYQLYTRWLEVLDEFASLDGVLGAITHPHALKQLKGLTAVSFQPQSTHIAPIQILGLLEAGGICFDHLWIMGLHDTAWPPPANPNPFIPLSLQTSLAMPHASSNRELNFCQIIIDRLLQSAKSAVLSFPEHAEDRSLRPSPLIHAIKSITLDQLNLLPYQSYTHTIFNSADIIYQEDHQGPQLLPDERINGGSAIFKHQAACPFRAFAQFRLGAQSLSDTQIGLSAAEQGSLLHRALEIFWNSVQDQQQLILLDQTALEHAIKNAVESALLPLIQRRPLTFKKHFKKLEKQRLENLLLRWINQEKNRPPFIVINTEQSQSFTVAQIPLQLRVDRIDQLADGSQIIIDYKTGFTNISAWFDDRPDEPQLPLYCVTGSTPTSGVVFAQVQKRDMQFKGISAMTVNIPGVQAIANLNNPLIPNDWQQLLQYWRNTLENLGQQFYAGHAQIDPKNAHKTCLYCDLQSLCRVGENQCRLG